MIKMKHLTLIVIQNSVVCCFSFSLTVQRPKPKKVKFICINFYMKL